jgi:hypothetical protein
MHINRIQALVIFSILTIPLQLIMAESSMSKTDSSAPGQSAELDLVIATKPDGPAEEILFRVIGEGKSTSIPLFIKQNGDTEVSDVRFFAYLADEEGQPIPGGVSFSLTAGGSDVTQTGLKIPADGKMVLATLHVTNLSAKGRFTGSLVAEHGGNVVEVAVLKGERFPLPALKMVGASAKGEIRLTSKVAAFNALLRLQSTNISRVEGLKIIVEDFSDPNGKQVPATYTINGQPGEGATITVPGLGSVELVISAELLTAGEYTSDITLLYTDTSDPFRLKVTRSRVAPTVSIEGVETVLGQTASRLTCVDQDNVNLWLTLRETGGQPAILNPPQFSVLSLKGAEESTFQAQFGGLVVKDKDGNSVNSQFTVEPDGTKPLQIYVCGLKKAGAYVGKLIFTAPGAPAIEEDVTILVKEPFWHAGLVIGVSVLLSFLISVWLKKTRPKLERQRYAHRLLSDLEREAKHIAQVPRGKKKLSEVVDDLRSRLEDLYDDSDLGTAVEAGEALKGIDEKISLFRRLADAYQQVCTLEPPKLEAGFSPELEKIRNEMLTRTSDSAKTAQTLLDKLFKDIEKALKDELLRQLKAFEGDVKTQSNETLRDEILSKIEKARSFAEKTPTPELSAAGLELQEARVSYALAMAEGLRTSLQDPPLGFDQISWSAPQQTILRKVDAVRREPDGEKAIAAYQDAYALYLATLIEKLIELLDEDLKVIEDMARHGQIKSEEAETLKDTIKPMIMSLNGTRAKIKERDLTAAKTEYNKALGTYTRKVQPKMGKSGMRMNESLRAGFSVALAAGGFIPEKVSEGSTDRSTDRHTRERKAIGRLIAFGDIVVTLVALVLAIAFGLEVLWDSNATWGGLSDYLVAVLWGFGLHQVGNQGAKGVGDVIAVWKK